MPTAVIAGRATGDAAHDGIGLLARTVADKGTEVNAKFWEIAAGTKPAASAKAA